MLALVVPVVLLYVVRARRRAMQDPFQFLWVGLARERPRWGRLHRWLELALVTIALAAMVVGLARPVTPTSEAPPRVRIVAIAEPSADALDRARALVAALGPGETAAVVVSSIDGARVALPPTGAPVARDAFDVDPTAPRDRAAVAGSAARIADAFAGAEVHWLDTGVEALSLPRGWRGHAVAPRGLRLAIEDVQRAADGRVSARLVNRGADRWRGPFRATLGDRTLAEELVELDPNAERSIAFAVDPMARGIVRLALADIDAVLALPNARPARIAVVARGGAASYVGRLLACFDPVVDPDGTVLIAPDRVDRVTRDAFDFALVLGPAPATDLPVPAIYFGAPNPLVSIDADGDTGPIRVTDAARDHALLAAVDLGTVGAHRSVACRAAAGVAVLARAEGRPVLFHRPPGAAPEALAFSFRLRDSNLLFEPALVVLIANAIERWGPTVVGGVADAPLSLPVGASVRIARRGDDGPIWSGLEGDGYPFRPRRAGRFDVSLADRALDAWVAPRSGVADASTAWERPADLAAPRPRDGWHERALWLAWLALALLCLEWVLFHRGIL